MEACRQLRCNRALSQHNTLDEPAASTGLTVSMAEQRDRQHSIRYWHGPAWHRRTYLQHQAVAAVQALQHFMDNSPAAHVRTGTAT